MKAQLKTATWQFCDAKTLYPELSIKRDVVVNSPHAVFEHFHFLFDNKVRERFVVLWLNSANKVLMVEVVTEGTLNSSLVHPREVFRGAIAATRALIILLHNHPSGSPQQVKRTWRLTDNSPKQGRSLGYRSTMT